MVGLPKGHRHRANSPHSIANGMGQTLFADKAINVVPTIREPSSAQINAVERAKNVVSLSILDRQKTHTGRAWGNIYYRELDSLREDGDLAAAVKAHIGSLRGDDRHKQIRELVTPQQFHAILRKAGVKAA